MAELLGQVGRAGPVGRGEPLEQRGRSAFVSHEDALQETQRAFDRVAADYDRSNTENRLLCAMRDRARRTVERLAPAGSRLLDLGCGPGADAEYFARRGYHVTAIDWSPAMVDEADRRIRAAALTDRVDVRRLGVHEIDALDPARFDAVYSNFGPLNCVPDLVAAARQIADRLRPGGVFVASVIGRLCPWEIALYLSRGDFRRAAVRFSRGPVPVPLAGGTVWTQYYTPRSFERCCAPAGFARASLRALGLCAPPPYLHAFAARNPRLVAALERIDDGIAGIPPFRHWGDHFLIALRRV